MARRTAKRNPRTMKKPVILSGNKHLGAAIFVGIFVLGTYRISSAQVTVLPAAVHINIAGSDQTLDGNESGTFTAEVSPPIGNVTGYSWTVSYPQGAGNNPSAPLTSTTGKITSVANAHWFALPDVKVGSSLESTYVLSVDVIVDGRIYTGTKNWTVYVPDPLGQTARPRITGMVNIQKRPDRDEWYVAGKGSLDRSLPESTINVNPSSQFYHKTDVHEARHRAQWASEVFTGSTFHTLFDDDHLYTILQNLTSTDGELALRQMCQKFIDLQNLSDNNKANAASYDAEVDAHTISSAVPPLYLDWY